MFSNTGGTQRAIKLIAEKKAVPEFIKKIMLNSIEHGIFPAHKC